MQTVNKVKTYYDTQGRVLLTKEFCHHWRTLKSKNRLMSWASPDCDLKFCYECILKYKPLLSYRRFLDNLKATKEMCLVWKDRCLWITWESCNLWADEELVDLITKHNYDSKFLVDNKDLVSKLIDKKNIIKKNNWAIWSFVKNLSPEKLQDGTIEEPHSDQILPNREFQTLDSLSSSSPINNICCKLNEENVSGIISSYHKWNKTKENSLDSADHNISDTKLGLDYTFPGHFKEECNKKSEDRLKQINMYKIPSLSDEMILEDYDPQWTLMTIALPFLCKAQSKSSQRKSHIETQEKRKKFKAIFKIQKI